MEGEDLCLPAAWTDGWLLAYSGAGGRREWTLPAGWEGVTRAAVRGITEQDWSQAKEVPVRSGSLEFEPRTGRGGVD